MATSKKLYVAVASIIAAELSRWKKPKIVDESPDVVLRRVATAFADEFAADNPHFDRARFMTACGLT